MVGLNDFLFQILQPYFLYSVLFLSIAFICIKIFLKFNHFMSRRDQSILWLTPLLAPVTVILLFNPQTIINISPFVPQISVPAGMSIAASSFSLLSFTGLLCISGAAAGAAYFALMIFFGKKIALKRLHVVIMAKDEYVSLQKKVKETADKLHIAEPKVGLIDDLLPNAFTIGYGQNTMIVFSLGLLNMLDLDELTAVASHELAHVKSRDYLFKSLSYALNILSFFNPFSYLTVSQFQKERELLADEKGVALLDEPDLMAAVLTKVEAVMQEFPKPSFADRFSSNLFLISPLAHRPGILAAHPQIAQRIRNIHAIDPTPSKKRRYMVATALLMSILVCTALVVGYSTLQAQKAFDQKEKAALVDIDGLYLYNESTPFDPAHPTGIFFANISNLQLFLLPLPPGSSYMGCYVDNNGVTRLVPSTSGVITVKGQDITVNVQSPFIGQDNSQTFLGVHFIQASTNRINGVTPVFSNYSDFATITPTYLNNQSQPLR